MEKFELDKHTYSDIVKGLVTYSSSSFGGIKKDPIGEYVKTIDAHKVYSRVVMSYREAVQEIKKLTLENKSLAEELLKFKKEKRDFKSRLGSLNGSVKKW